MTKKVDLSFGNPAFLHSYWQNQDLPETEFYYPYPYPGETPNEGLEDAIRKIHKAIDNVVDVDKYHIAIGNGATQLLSAILYETFGTTVSAPAPYFLRFPVIAQIGANQWVTTDSEKVILSAPNNPTGELLDYALNHKKDSRIKIIDACYNWPQYTEVEPLDDDILVFSLSKATGHAGARLGWALFKDEQLAKDVRRSVEMTTMGVSAMAQEVGRFILSHEAKRHLNKEHTVFEFGKDELRGRWNALAVHKPPFNILNTQGMFAWCEGEIPEHVTGILGSQFGVDNKKFRLNIGCSRYDFFQFIEPYLKEDEDGTQSEEV